MESIGPLIIIIYPFSSVVSKVFFFFLLFFLLCFGTKIREYMMCFTLVQEFFFSFSLLFLLQIKGERKKSWEIEEWLSELFTSHSFPHTPISQQTNQHKKGAKWMERKVISGINIVSTVGYFLFFYLLLYSPPSSRVCTKKIYNVSFQWCGWSVCPKRMLPSEYLSRGIPLIISTASTKLSIKRIHHWTVNLYDIDICSERENK